MNTALRDAAKQDPLALAMALDQPGLHAVFNDTPLQGWMNPALRDKSTVQRVANALRGRDVLPTPSEDSGPIIMDKNHWHELFKETAVRYHHLDPEGYGKWIARFPDAARNLASQRIKMAEEDAKITAKPEEEE